MATSKGDVMTLASSTDSNKSFSSRSLIWRAINVVMAIFFLFCAIAQVNDPDPYIWMPIYLVPCLLCATVSFSRSATEYIAWKWLLIIHVAACLVGVVYLTVMVVELINGRYTENPLSKEEGRELAGLVVVVFWLSICLFSGFNDGLQKPPLKTSILLCMAVIVGLMPLALWSLCLMENAPSIGHCADML